MKVLAMLGLFDAALDQVRAPLRHEFYHCASRICVVRERGIVMSIGPQLKVFILKAAT